MKNLKNTILNNIGLKLLAIVGAIIMWLVVINISDYSVTVEVDDIPVEQLNGDVLEELDQIYDVEHGDTVDIIVKGRRSIVSRLSRADFRATADLSTMSITNSVQIKVEPKDLSIYDDISITCIDNTMSLILEDKISLQFPIKVNVIGTPKEGYAVGETNATPNIITIEGPKSTLERITEVGTNVSADLKSADFETEGRIYIFDAYGDVVSNDRMVVSNDIVNVKVSMYPVKSIPVNVKVKGKPDEGYGVGEIQYQPQNITIAGPQEKLDKIDEINIDDIRISGLKEDLQTSVNVNDYLPDGVFVAQSSAEIVINVRIEEYVDKTLKIKPENITLNNKNSEYSYDVIVSEGYTINVSGLSDDMADVDIKSLKLSVDCSNLSVGDNINVTLDMNKSDKLEYKTNGVITIVVKEDI